MSQIEIAEFFELTSEQESLLTGYRDKWRAIALSTKPINRKKATEAVFTAYKFISKKEPKILFLDNPYVALKVIFTELKE